MNIVCVICSDQLTPSDDVFITPCGHIFHFACVTQWLERSKSCPQCRDRVTQSKIHRIYFNFSQNDTITEDASTLQLTIDSLKFQVLVKDKEIKQALLKNDKYHKETAGLRGEVRKLENELTQKDTAIQAQKEQLKYFRSLGSESENAKKEVARLKKKLEEYRGVQLLINAPNEDVDEMVKSTQDPATLFTYISVMKRELTTSVTRRKELRASVKKLQQDLTKVSMERNFLSEEHEKRKQLEEMLAIVESEKYALENRLRELENGKTVPKQKTASSRKSNNDELTSKIIDLDDHDVDSNESSSARNKSDIVDLSEESPLKQKVRSSKQNDRVMSPSNERIRGNEENSPLSEYKISAEWPKKKARVATGNSTYSILAKKPRLGQSHDISFGQSLREFASKNKDSSTDLTYDGFGGHSKVDKFPSPKKHSSEMPKTKRSTANRATTKKSKLSTGIETTLGDFLSSYQAT